MTLLVIGDKTDQLIHSIRENLPGHQQLFIPKERLAEQQIQLDGRQLRVNDTPIEGVLFLALPTDNFSTDFINEDQHFCNTEMKALWLACLHLNNIFTINSYRSDAWFDGLTWIFWRRKLEKLGIETAPVRFGLQPEVEQMQQWLPYLNYSVKPIPDQAIIKFLGVASTNSSTVQKVTFYREDIVDSENRCPNITQAVRALNAEGVKLGAFTLDDQDRILQVSTNPYIENPRVAGLIVEKINLDINEYMYSRR